MEEYKKEEHAKDEVSTKKLDDDVNRLDKHVKQFARFAPKLWTLESITFMLFIFGFLSFALSFWEQVSLVPKIGEHYSEVAKFEDGRNNTFNDVRKAWTNMRLAYLDFINDCAEGKLTTSKMEQYSVKNSQFVDEARQAAAEVMAYYYGASIYKIYVAELQWYVNHADQCPIQPGSIGAPLNLALHYRQNMLMLLLLNKSYNPNLDDRYHNNPYYTNLQEGK